MARSHARFYVTIWSDADFLALTPGAQRAYFFLCSQGTVSHLGVLPLTVRRWARAAAGYTAEALHEDLIELETARFIVLDEDTDELLIRSHFRHDAVYKQPYVLANAVESLTTVQSKKIKRALLEEVERVTLDDLEDSKRKGVEGHFARLVEALRNEVGNPSDKGPVTPADTPAETPSGTPSGRGPATPSGTPPETPSGTPSSRVHAHVGAPTQARPLPLPPSPSSSPGTPSASRPRTRGSTAPAEQPKRIDVEQICQAMAAAAERVTDRKPTITESWRREARLLIDNDGRTLPAVLAVIKWVEQDEFWRTNILGVPKLRKQFDQVYARAKVAATARKDYDPNDPRSELMRNWR